MSINEPEIDELKELIKNQCNRLEALTEGTDGSTPAIVTICRLREENDQLTARNMELEKCMSTPRAEDLAEIERLRSGVERLASTHNLRDGTPLATLKDYMLEREYRIYLAAKSLEGGG